MAFYPHQGKGLIATSTTTSYNPPHHHHMLSFTGSSSDSTLMPPSTIGEVLPPPPNPSSLPSAPKYKFVTALPADWTTQEVATLEEGLIRHAHEPNITKYIKIAAMLPAKTIRDVALRCCWTLVKESRRKPDDYYAGRNMSYLKNKMAASTSEANNPMLPPNNAFLFPLSLHHTNQNSLIPMEAAPGLDSATQRLLEQNNQLLGRIAANIKTLKTEETTDLFLRANNNIRAILERMREIGGIMGEMPSLPVHVNEEHLSSLVHLHRGVSLT